MATVRPFRALRPAPDAAARVAAVPYDVVNVDEARALSAGNPLSFLRVSRAEIELDGVDPHAESVYERARANFETLRRTAPLVMEDQPSLYFYHLRMGLHAQTGLAGAYSLDEYDRDVIKKHERTRPDKEDDRTRHIVTLRAQTGPVFLTYRASPEIDAVAARATAAAPLYDFTAPDDVQHTVWRVSDADASAIGAALGRVPFLYIADGHHRAAAAARARASLGTSQAASTFLAVAFPDDQVQILPYNRVVRDLAGMTPEGFVAEVRSRFRVTEGSSSPRRKGEAAMYVAGRWHSVVLGEPRRDGAGVVAGLDVTVLQDRLLAPVLKITDVRTDKRIDFVGGIRGPAELERLVDAGRAAAAFAMFPVTVDDLMRIADEGGIMPPKSTWFEPKLRDGLLIHTI